MIEFVAITLVQKSVTDSLTATNIITLLVGSGVLTAVGYAVKSWFQKQLIKAQAEQSEATAAQIVSKSAAELVNPLRLELQTVRVELEDVRTKLSNCQVQASNLSHQLAQMTRKNEELLLRNRELEEAAR